MLNQLVPFEKRSNIVSLRLNQNELVADKDVRPGDKVKTVQVDGLPIHILYEYDEPTLAQVTELLQVESKVEEMPFDVIMATMPLTDMSIFGLGSLLESNPHSFVSSGVYALENLSDLQESLPWYLGYLLSVIRDKWEDSVITESDGLFRHFSGESFDGVATRITKKAYQTYMQWIQCAKLYLRNSTGADWLRQVTVDYIIHEVKMSNAWVAASSVMDGSITAEAITALLSGKSANEIRHELASRNNGTDPKVVEPEKLKDAIDKGEFETDDSFEQEPSSKLDLEDDWVQTGPSTPQWMYDGERKSIGYWLDDKFTVALRVVDDSVYTSGMVMQMLSRLPIRPSKHGPVVEEAVTVDDTQAIVEWYYNLLESEPSVDVRKTRIEESQIPIARITQAVRYSLKRLLLEEFGDRCPIDSTEATDLHEVMLLRNDAKPLTMLGVNAYNPNNCILVSRAVNRKAENPTIRRQLVDVMEARGYDPVGWATGLRDKKLLKGYFLPSIAEKQDPANEG